MPEMIDTLKNSESLTPEAIFVSQFQLGLPKAVERCACGIASLAMAYNALRGKGIKNMAEFATDFISAGRYTLPVVCASFNSLPTKRFPVLTYSQIDTDNVKAINTAGELVACYAKGNTDSNIFVLNVQPAGNVYKPTFTMEKGVDSRGMMFWLQGMGFKAELYEFNQNPNSIPFSPTHKIMAEKKRFLESFGESIRTAGNIVIASVVQSLFRYPPSVDIIRDPRLPNTHLVTILHGNEMSLLYLDPAFVKPSDGVKTTGLTAFQDALVPEGRTRSQFLVISKT